eukprot:1175986-Prorocentrum_minimum.AAC.1
MHQFSHQFFTDVTCLCGALEATSLPGWARTTSVTARGGGGEHLRVHSEREEVPEGVRKVVKLDPREMKVQLGRPEHAVHLLQRVPVPAPITRLESACSGRLHQ